MIDPTDVFNWLCRKYVQRADDRQKSLGLQYTEAETHDLAEQFAGYAASRATQRWRPFTELPASYRTNRLMFVARGVVEVRAGSWYTTDPYCVWMEGGRVCDRWPHNVEPTEFIELPQGDSETTVCKAPLKHPARDGRARSERLKQLMDQHTLSNADVAAMLSRAVQTVSGWRVEGTQRPIPEAELRLLELTLRTPTESEEDHG